MKFLRNIRRQLFSSGQGKRYIAYAGGEIVLIMVGILLALQINNWNERRIIKEKEQLFLMQLREDFNADLNQLYEKKELTQGILQAVEVFLKAIDDSTSNYRDSTNFYISRLFAAPTFDPVTAYLMRSESLTLIKNNKLKRRLSTWNSDYTQLLEAERTWKKLRDDSFLHYIIPRYPLRNMHDFFWKEMTIKRGLLEDPGKAPIADLGQSKRNNQRNTLFEEEEFEDYLSHIYTNNRIASLQIDALEKRILEILKLIEAETRT
jgi:hypothetical protein